MIPSANASLGDNNPEDFRFYHLTPEDGLPFARVIRIIQDYLGFMWFATDNGLVKYDSVQGKQFNRIVSFKMSDGMLLFCGIYGFNGFHPDISTN